MQLPEDIVNNHAYRHFDQAKRLHRHFDRAKRLHRHFDRAKRAEKSIPTNLAEADANKKLNSTVLIRV